MWPFKRRPLLDDDTAQWHIDNACWFLRHFGRTPMVTNARLILPGRGYFRLHSDLTGIGLAREILKQMKGFIGRPDWVLDISAEGEADETTIFLPGDAGDDPFRLICWLSYDLAWRVMASLSDDPPCDESNWKCLAEAAACFMGFGVFLADVSVISNTRPIGLNHVSEPEAYAAELSTWLPESDIVFDLAIFLTFKELSADAALSFLKPFVADKLKTAMIDIQPY